MPYLFIFNHDVSIKRLQKYSEKQPASSTTKIAARELWMQKIYFSYISYKSIYSNILQYKFVRMRKHFVCIYSAPLWNCSMPTFQLSLAVHLWLADREASSRSLSQKTVTRWARLFMKWCMPSDSFMNSPEETGIDTSELIGTIFMNVSKV